MNKLIIVFVSYLLLQGCSGEHQPSAGTANTKKIGTENLPIELKKLNDAIAANPTNASGYHSRALYYLEKNDLNNAYEDLKYVFTIDSVTALYHCTLADYHIKNKEPELAFFAIKTYLKKYPTSALAHLKMGELYYYGKEYPRSFESLNTALKIDKYLSKAYYFKGLNFLDLNKPKEANSSFQTCIEQDPNFYDAYIQLALLNLASNAKLAKQYYLSAVRVNPKGIDGWYGLGYLAQQEENIDGALSYYATLLEIDANYSDALYNSMQLYIAKNNLDSAKLFYNRCKALSIKPDRLKSIAREYNF